MAIASRGGASAVFPQSDHLSAAELLAWRRSMLSVEGAGSASGLDWLLDLAGGLDWPTLQALWLHPQRRVQLKASLQELEALWRRHCLDAEPLQYLVGRCPWRDLELSVAPGVLIPRQETELLLELALSLAPEPPAGRPLCWADLGTGSGCLAIGLARSLPASVGLAVDASPEALRQAAANLRALLPAGSLPAAPFSCGPEDAAAPTPWSAVPQSTHPGAAMPESTHPQVATPRAAMPWAAMPPAAKEMDPEPGSPPALAVPMAAGVRLCQGSWWHAIRPWWGQLQLVVSNPPYIPTAVLAALEPVVRDHEPALALDGGVDGLEAIRPIVSGAEAALAPGGVLLLEHHHDQSEAVLALLAASGLEACRAHRDLEGVWRFASARRPWRQTDTAAPCSAPEATP